MKKYKVTLKNGDVIYTDDINDVKDEHFRIGKNVLIIEDQSLDIAKEE